MGSAHVHTHILTRLMIPAHIPASIDASKIFLHTFPFVWLMAILETSSIGYYCGMRAITWVSTKTPVFCLGWMGVHISVWSMSACICSTASYPPITKLNKHPVGYIVLLKHFKYSMCCWSTNICKQNVWAIVVINKPTDKIMITRGR